MRMQNGSGARLELAAYRGRSVEPAGAPAADEDDDDLPAALRNAAQALALRRDRVASQHYVDTDLGEK